MVRYAPLAFFARMLLVCGIFGCLLGTTQAAVNSLTIFPGASGSGTQDANLLADGVINPGDAGGGAETLSSAALASVPAGTNISITVGTSITFNDLGGTVATPIGQNVSFTANTGAITFNNTTNGVSTTSASLTFSAATTLTTAKLSTSGGNIFLTANNMAIGGTINAGAGTVTLQPFTNGTLINLGGADGVNTLGLTDAELDLVTAAILRVGSTNAGNLTITATVSPAGSNTLSLHTGGTLSQNGGAGLIVTNLAVRGAAGVNLPGISNQISTVAGAVTNAGAGFAFRSSIATLTVGTVDGFVGVSTNGGAVNPIENIFAAINPGNPGALTVNNAVISNGGNITFFADLMTINNVVNAGSARVYFDTEILNRPLNLGNFAANTLSLLQSDFNNVTAGVVQVGEETINTGGLTVSGPIVAPAGGPGTWTSLDLRNVGALSGAVGGSLTVATVSFTAGGGSTHTFNINNATSGPNSFKEDGNGTIPYTSFNVTVNAGAGSDTFNVTPSATTVFRMNGNLPVTVPGDSLIVNTAGATGTLLTRSNPAGQTHDGRYTFTNRQTIFFTSIETLNPITNPTATDGSVSGFILDQDGRPIEGVGILMSGSQNRLTVTDTNGYYHFENVEENGLYVLTPARLNYNFSPVSRQFSQLGQHTDAAFTAVYNGESNNPLDRTEYFVRQQYVDFLGREPDEAGFTAWVNGINNCAPDDSSCDRVHVSEMFFRSTEFQQRGYFLYRFYSTAFGRKPDYAEFTPDMARVSGFLTNEQLQAAKAKFADDFAARPLFVSMYGGLNNADYVDALLHTAQVSVANRDDLIASLNSGTLTRAQVLRQIVESSEVFNRYYNQAFVVMEYFGYLRRDPDALYLEWIEVLNQTGDARHMAEGFVDSSEYRNRFAR